jgi:hypothetical protein
LPTEDSPRPEENKEIARPLDIGLRMFAASTVIG